METQVFNQQNKGGMQSFSRQYYECGKAGFWLAIPVWEGKVLVGNLRVGMQSFIPPNEGENAGF